MRPVLLTLSHRFLPPDVPDEALRQMTPTAVHVSTVHRWDDARITRREIPTLCAAGYHVVWAVPAESDVSVDLPSTARLEALPELPAWRRWLGLPSLARRLASIDAAVFHLHDPELLLIADTLRRRSNAIVIYDKHEYQRGRRGVKAALIRLVERIAIPLVDGLVVVDYSDPANPATGAAPDLDDLALSEVKVAVVPNYLAEPYYERLSEVDSRASADREIRLVYTGVVAGERGLWMMLDMLEALHRTGRAARLVLVGICFRRAEREEFDRAVNRRGLRECVEQVGWTRYATADEVAREIAHADVGLMLMDTSYRAWSNIPTKFYEYMASGLPYVCTAYPAWSRFVQGRGGVVIDVDRFDPAVAARTVVGIVDSPATRSALSDQGRRASRQFLWSRSEFALRTLYAQLRFERSADGRS